MAKKEVLCRVEELEFHRKPILKLSSVDDGRCQVLFGVAKAKMILDNISAIREFVAKYDNLPES